MYPIKLIVCFHCCEEASRPGNAPGASFRLGAVGPGREAGPDTVDWFRGPASPLPENQQLNDCVTVTEWAKCTPPETPVVPTDAAASPAEGAFKPSAAAVKSPGAPTARRTPGSWRQQSGRYRALDDLASLRQTLPV